MSSQNDGGRTGLRAVGVVVICLGFLLLVLGIQQQGRDEERRKQQTDEFMAGQRKLHDIDNGPGAGFFMIGGGMLSVALGIALVASSFQRAILRYQMRQAAPVLREALREVAPGLAGGPVRVCRHCKTECSADARFCKECGAPLAQTRCRGCGADNDPDAKFCAGCGSPL